MSKLLPKDSFTIQSDLSAEAIAAKLTHAIAPAPPVRTPWNKPKTPYSGKVTTTGFEAIRVIHYRNSFLPQVRGQFEPLSPSGTAVRITLAPHPVVLAFLAVWYFHWYGISLVALLAGGMPGPMALLFLGLPLLIGFAFWAAFWSEAKRSRRDFIQLIDGQVQGQTESSSSLGFAQGLAQRSLRRNRKPWVLAGLGMAVVGLVLLLQQRSVQQLESTPSAITDAAANACIAPCEYVTRHSITSHPQATVVALSPDGTVLASGGTDKAIKVWDVETGQLRKTLQSDSGVLQALAISADNQTIVSGSGDRMIRIWDLTSSAPPLMLPGHESEPRIVRLTPDGKTIVSSSFNELKQWDLSTGELLTERLKREPKLIKLGPIETTVTTGPYSRVLGINDPGQVAIIQQDNDLLAWNLETDQQVKLPHNAHWSHIGKVAISPNGKIAVSQHDNGWRKFETRLKVWDLSQGRLQAEGEMDYSRRSFPQGAIAVSDAQVLGQANGVLATWDFKWARPQGELSEQNLRTIAINSDGRILAGVANTGMGEQTALQLLERSD